MRPIGNKISWLFLTGVLFFAVVAITTTQGALAAGSDDSEARITRLPESLDKNCRRGRARLYDECGDQLALFITALKRAKKERKVLLISYGAEWCIWCHVFDKYIHGGKTRFKYTYGTPDDPDLRETATLYEKEKSDVTRAAKALKAYVSKTFVVVHIDAQFAPNGNAVLVQTGAIHHYDGGLPYIFTVNTRGHYAEKFEHNRVETRRDGFWDWYRGYSRQGLMEHLAELRTAALAPGSE